MPLPEYVQTWLTGFDESSEPVDCSMISLILYTRLAERQTPADEVKSIFRVLAPLEFHIRPRGGSPWNRRLISDEYNGMHYAYRLGGR
jgi:hypothetical protein